MICFNKSILICICRKGTTLQQTIYAKFGGVFLVTGGRPEERTQRGFADLGWAAGIPLLHVEIAALIALVVYSVSLVNGFSYDDYLVVVKNPWIGREGFLSALFSQRYFQISGEASYRPVVTFFYWLFAAISGSNPFAFHLFCVVFHALTAAAVTCLAQKTGLQAGALWVGVAFAIHPVLSEAVCSIGFCEDILSTFFLVVSVICLIRFAGKPRSVSTHLAALVSMTAFFLALFSKESAVALIPIVATMAWLAPLIGLERRGIVHALALLVPVAGFYLWVRFIAMPGIANSALPLSQDPAVVVATSSKIISSYLGRLVCPFEVSICRTTQLIQPASLIFLLSISVHLLLVFAALALRKTLPLFLLGILWFYFALAPVSNIVPIFNPEADRYLYLPSIGFFIATGAILEALSARFMAFNRYILTAMVMLQVLWVGKTVVREGDWYNNSTLWGRELSINRKNTQAMTELAIEANRGGRYAESEKMALKALAIDDNLALARLQLAKSLLMQGRNDEAFAAYLSLLQKGGLHAHHLSQAWFDMAYLLHRIMSDRGQAVTAYRNVLAVDPFHLGASLNLAGLYMDMGDFASAAGVCRDALNKFPANAELQDCLARAEKRISGK